jgi:NhaP-type Na+/H+ or K+/H+ antiporter
VVIIARFAWMYPATYLPRWLIPAIRRKDPSPPWQWPTALAFTGVRGIVSLAAALGIPFTTDSSETFPQRDLILFLTFSVILVTLVGQGLMLPMVIRSLGLARAGRRERHADREEEFVARRLAIEAAIERLSRLASERQLSDDIVRPHRAHLRERLRQVEHRSDGDRGGRKLAELDDEMEFQLIEAERQAINDRYRRGQLKDEARRRVERELDLRDAHLADLRPEG